MNKFYTITKTSLQQEGVSDLKALWHKAQADGYGALKMQLPASFEKKEVDNDNLYHAVFSTADTDRHGDQVFQSFDLSGFEANPVVLDSHDYSSIEKIVGKVTNASTENGRLEGDIEFFVDNPRGALTKTAVDQGFVSTLSIGFIPLEFDADGNITHSELLEVSAVSVPANKFATFEEKTAKKEVETEEEGVKEEETENSLTEPSNPSPTLPKEGESEENSDTKTKGEGVVLRKLQEELDKRERVLKLVAKELTQTNSANVTERKRKIWKTLRELL